MKNIKLIYKNTTIGEKINGENWYFEARQFAAKVSNDHKVDFLKVCGVISALSPSVQWDVNKFQAENLILHMIYGQRSICSTYANNVLKAEQIFRSDGTKKAIEKILLGKVGFKTLAFFRNISDENSNDVTIDRHILTAIGFDKPSLTRKRYYEIEGKFKRTAKGLGITPYMLQAIIWINQLSNPAS